MSKFERQCVEMSERLEITKVLMKLFIDPAVYFIPNRRGKISKKGYPIKFVSANKDKNMKPGYFIGGNRIGNKFQSSDVDNELMYVMEEQEYSSMIKKAKESQNDD